jgi:hypothetical protein
VDPHPEQSWPKKQTNWKVVLWKIDDDYNMVPGTQQR